MSGSTISNKVTITVTVGVGGYVSPLTITNTGYAAAGVYLSAVGESLVNRGMISGYQQDNRGYGVYAPVGNVTNYGTIIGAANSTNGYGGTGVGFTNRYGRAASLDNLGIIVGGAGGSGTSGGFFGGQGVTLASYGTSFTNSGTIRGGTGGDDLGSGTGSGGIGGIGVKLDGVPNGANYKLIVGGAGGVGTTGDSGGGGGDGVYVFQQSTLTNFGTLIGGAGGHGSTAGGNGGAGAVIVYGTLTNAGTIAGGSGGSGSSPGKMGDAVSFRSGSSELIVDPGAVFLGSVVGTSQYYSGNTLAFGKGSVAGTIYGIGSQIYGFKDISFASGAAWTIGGTYTGFDGHEFIKGLAPSDTIILQGFAANTADVSFVAGTGLELASGSTTITLDIVGNFSTSNFVVTDPPGSTTLSVVQTTPCFTAGTRILSEHGEVAVEALEVGNRVVLHGGGVAPIVWIGRRQLNLLGHPRPEAVQPILIEAGAICGGVPARPLLVSPDHALYLDGHLIPAKALLNGFTIRQMRRSSVSYFHVETDAHTVIYAEGCPVESYLETGNRGAFENGGTYVMLHPDFGQMTRETTGCAPFAERGPVVEAVRARLLTRAGIETTRVPDLDIRMRRDGAAVVVSRSAIPGEIGADPRDWRRLGVKIAALRDGDRDIPLDHPALTKGWHAPEPDGRWTDGKAEIPAALARSGTISVRLAATLDYPLAPSCRAIG